VVLLSDFGCSRARSRVRAGALALAITAVAFGAAACGADAPQQAAGTTVTTAPSTTTTTRPVPTAAELQDRALTAADLPPGWSVEPEKDAAGGKASGPADEGPAEFLCPEAAASSSPSSPLAKKAPGHENVVVQLNKSPGGPFLMQVLDGDEAAETQYGEAARLFRGCVGKTWTMDSDDLPMAMSVIEVPAPEVGDEAAAYRITGKASQAPLTLTIDFVVVRRGAVIQFYGAITPDSPVLAAKPMTADELAGIVRAGDEKIAATRNPT
jgi:hypothetical protein